MFDRDDLRAAVSADIISADQAARLEAFMTSRHAAGDDAGQETLRFLSNFNDIFVTIGIAILFIGITAFSGMIFGTAGSITNSFVLALVFAPVALAALAMMEYFCARRRMLLPSMALAVIFVSAVATGVAGIFAQMLGDDISSFWDAIQSVGALGVTTFGGALAASLFVFWRHRLPFSLLLAALSATGIAYAGAASLGDTGAIFGGGLSFLMGLATFAAAIWFDMRDPERVRRASDHAFWLHAAAAPQLILGISALSTGSNMFAGATLGADNAFQGLVLLATLVLMGVIALALNRRALIAASLLTFIWTLGFVLNEAGMDGLGVFMTVTMVVGGGVVLLGAGWKTARRMTLRLFPRGGLWDRLFPPEIA